MAKTVLITGSSTGFGKLTAKKFQTEGWNVVATMRSPEKETELNQLSNVLVTQLDVTKKETIANAIQKTNDKFGTIDVLVNNAGYGTLGPLEAASEEEIRYQMEVNFFGLINVTKAVLPDMRAQKSGTIVNISSIGGLITFPYFSLYHASKFAVEGLTEAMEYELNPLGIKLKIIEPGGFKTEFGTGSLKIFDTKGFEDYQEKLGSFLKIMQSRPLGGDAQDVAEAIYEASIDDSNQLRYLVGKDAEKLAAVRKQMDAGSFKNIMKERYGF